MDRIRQLKLAMSRLKKRNFSPRPEKKKESYNWRKYKDRMTPEEIKAHRADDVQRVIKSYRNRRANKVCIRCGKPSIVISYELEGRKLVQRSSIYCPAHWESPTLKEEFKRALSTDSTIDTVHPMVTLKHKARIHFK